MRDYNLATAKSPVQTHIDTRFFTKKGKQAREVIGESWARFFFTSGIPATRARSVDSDDETQGSPDYQEPDESSSRTDTDDGDEGGQGGQGPLMCLLGGHTTQSDHHSLIQFTGKADFSHATQDQDHGAPSSQRTIVTLRGWQQQQQLDTSQDSYSSFNASNIESGYPTYVYNRPTASDYPPPTWVYK